MCSNYFLQWCCFGCFIGYKAAALYSLHQVVRHDEYTCQVDSTANTTQCIKWFEVLYSFKELVFQLTFFGKGFPHGALCKASPVHRHCVQQDTDSTHPEV